VSGPGLEEVQGHRAGFVTRGVAFAIDFFCVLVAYPLTLWAIGLVMGIMEFTRPEYPELDAWLDVTIHSMILFWYFVGPWSLNGRTLGQGLMGLRVVGRARRRVYVWQAAVRWLVLFATLFVVGPVWLAFSGKRLAIHDRLSRTQVIYERAPRRTAVSVDLHSSHEHVGDHAAAGAAGAAAPPVVPGATLV
jgi:uncharacterized RDD family membrane protein YckC